MLDFEFICRYIRDTFGFKKTAVFYIIKKNVFLVQIYSIYIANIRGSRFFLFVSKH